MPLPFTFPPIESPITSYAIFLPRPFPLPGPRSSAYRRIRHTPPPQRLPHSHHPFIAIATPATSRSSTSVHHAFPRQHRSGPTAAQTGGPATGRIPKAPLSSRPLRHSNNLTSSEAPFSRLISPHQFASNHHPRLHRSETIASLPTTTRPLHASKISTVMQPNPVRHTPSPTHLPNSTAHQQLSGPVTPSAFPKPAPHPARTNHYSITARLFPPSDIAR